MCHLACEQADLFAGVSCKYLGGKRTKPQTSEDARSLCDTSNFVQDFLESARIIATYIFQRNKPFLLRFG